MRRPVCSRAQRLLKGEHPCKGTGRVSGVSPHFVWERGLGSISVYVDCTDQVSSVALLHQPRLYHAAAFVPTPAPYGQVVVSGGASFDNLADIIDPTKANVHDSIEVFDAEQGGFRLLSTTLPGRAPFTPRQRSTTA